MKKLELEQLRKDINARIDAIINKPEEFVKGRWYMQAKLEEAKLKYVNGTEFKSVESGYKYKVENGIKIGGQGRENELYCINSNGIGMGVIYNGDTDTWAEIIPQDKGANTTQQTKRHGNL